MRRPILAAIALVAIAGASLLLLNARPAEAGAGLSVAAESFRIARPGAPPLTSRDLVGAVFQMTTAEGRPVTVRIDAVTPAREQPGLLLHALSVKTPTGWAPFCETDAYGRSAGFPVAGAWQGERFVADPKQWFITCTSGSQGKCILFGYDPWKRGPHGENLVPYYEACQRMVRADYFGSGRAHTKNGTLIDIWDHIGIQSDEDPTAPFEAGWTPAGAACVAKTRWPDLMPLDRLRQAAPALAVACDERAAAQRGAILFNRSR